MRTQRDFLNLLFDAGDETCFALDKYNTELSNARLGADEVNYETQWFCINALNGSRKDANVTKHRTFLIEFDNLPLDEQFNTFKDSCVPYSAMVYSGSKSHHFFIVLNEPVSAEEYAAIVKRLHLKLPACDRTTRNPSRLARLPEVIRPDTQKEQKLWHCGARVVLSELLSTLPDLPTEPVIERSNSLVSSTIVLARHNPEAVMRQIGIEGRNQFFYWLGQRLIEASLPKDVRKSFVKDVYSKLSNKTDFNLREALAAARV